MSTLPPKADIADGMKNVCFVPKADIRLTLYSRYCMTCRHCNELIGPPLKNGSGANSAAGHPSDTRSTVTRGPWTRETGS